MRIVIVEDNRDGAESLAAVLEDLGHEPLIASTGAQAEALLADGRTQVAFIDLLLPDVHGVDLARGLRLSSPATLLVAVTGLGARDVRDRALAAGFTHFLLKPYALSALEAILAAAQR